MFQPHVWLPVSSSLVQTKRRAGCHQPVLHQDVSELASHCPAGRGQDGRYAVFLLFLRVHCELPVRVKCHGCQACAVQVVFAVLIVTFYSRMCPVSDVFQVIYRSRWKWKNFLSWKRLTPNQVSRWGRVCTWAQVDVCHAEGLFWQESTRLTRRFCTRTRSWSRGCWRWAHLSTPHTRVMQSVADGLFTCRGSRGSGRRRCRAPSWGDTCWSSRRVSLSPW